MKMFIQWAGIAMLVAPVLCVVFLLVGFFAWVLPVMVLLVLLAGVLLAVIASPVLVGLYLLRAPVSIPIPALVETPPTIEWAKLRKA